MWAGLAAIALTVVVLRDGADRAPVELLQSAPPQRAQITPIAPPASSPLKLEPQNTPVATEPSNRSREVMAGQEPGEKMAFEIDAKGHIVADEDARLNMEKLFALNAPGDRVKKQRELEESLPPAAGRELSALLARYDTYQETQLQTFPPGQEMASPAQGLVQLDGLHELRVQAFGAVVAASLFGAEEKKQRDMLLQMALDQDKNPKLDEKPGK